MEKGEDGQHRNPRRGRMRLIDVIVNGCRLAIVLVAWWGLFGFRGVSGVQLLEEGLRLGTKGAAALVASALAVLLTTAMLLSPADLRRLYRAHGRRKTRACMSEDAKTS